MIRRRKKTEMMRKYMILVINIAPMTKDILYFRAKKKEEFFYSSTCIAPKMKIWNIVQNRRDSLT